MTKTRSSFINRSIYIQPIKINSQPHDVSCCTKVNTLLYNGTGTGGLDLFIFYLSERKIGFLSF